MIEDHCSLSTRVDEMYEIDERPDEVLNVCT